MNSLLSRLPNLSQITLRYSSREWNDFRMSIGYLRSFYFFFLGQGLTFSCLPSVRKEICKASSCLALVSLEAVGGS